MSTTLKDMLQTWKNLFAVHLQKISINLCQNVLNIIVNILSKHQYEERSKITFAQLRFTSLYQIFLPSWIWLYNNTIYCEFSCKLCYWKSFVEKGLSKNVNDCCFMATNFISTKMNLLTFTANECQRKVLFTFWWL